MLRNEKIVEALKLFINYESKGVRGRYLTALHFDVDITQGTVRNAISALRINEEESFEFISFLSKESANGTVGFLRYSIEKRSSTRCMELQRQQGPRKSVSRFLLLGCYLE